MKFETALLRLKNGKKLTRKNWNGKNMYIQLQRPDQDSKMTQPYIYMKTVDDDLVPWTASQTDMLSDDWQIYHPGTNDNNIDADVKITIVTINELKQVIREVIQELNTGQCTHCQDEQCQHEHGQEHENIGLGGQE